MTVDAEPAPFDPCGPLPGPGVTVLEASAGTGKTFTIAALVARLVADGVPVEKILAVTFTRMATTELRDRVRARLVTSEESLGRFLDAGVRPAETDRVATLLATGTLGEVNERRRRLADALSTFDAATITTTHGFCQLVLAGLGVMGSVGVGAALIEDASDVIGEAVDDLFVRGVLHWGQLPFGRREVFDIAREAIANPLTPLEPERSDSDAGMQRRLADQARQEVARRLWEANLMTYDDLLVQLRAALADDERGERACQMLRSRYSVVLVDEFQDTDPIQWEVVRRAFGDGSVTLVLIGDPKQAIYAFRGADVYSYLDAARLADQRFTLSENWRCDEGLLDAYDALLDPLNVGHPDIRYRRVTAAPAHARSGLVSSPAGAPLRIRMLHTADGLVTLNASTGTAQKDSVQEWIARDVAGDLVRLLDSEATLVESSRSIAPGDVAVLVRTNRQAGIVHSALRAAGVAAVVGGTESVFAAPGAGHWLRLLESLEQPASRTRAAACALTPFVGMTAAEVASADETTWEDLHARLHVWADVLRRRGVATLARAVLASEGMPSRVLRDAAGERALTDLGHIAQLLHAEGSASGLGPPALRAWLAGRIEAVGSESTDADERSLRLDSDADAVQVLTVHRAKGLEFPVVYCPYLWDAGMPLSKGKAVVYHDSANGDRRTLDVGVAGASPSYLRHLDAARDEQRGEDLRLLYVALTRARHQAVLWWVRAHHSEHSPLGRVIMSRDLLGNVATGGRYTPKDSEMLRRFEQLAALAPGTISVERCLTPSVAGRAQQSAPGRHLVVAYLDRTLDLSWRRTSYTGITAGAHGDLVDSEPEDSGLGDEPAGPATPAISAAPDTGEAGSDETSLRAFPSLWAELPGGADVGTFVHGVLEAVDFRAGDLEPELAAAISREQTRRSTPIGAPGALEGGLAATISTPLGPLAAGTRLRDLGRADRLDELGFELPLAGGDDPIGEVVIRDVARLFVEHTASGSALQGYATRLTSPVLASHFRGYLTGSLDLVLRVTEPSGPPRFMVVDYKTNWLAPEGEPLSAWHYRPAALAAEMQRAHYPLQAALYLVALHRYLRWRLPGYDPAINLAGVLYLFVRGMGGPTTPVVDGSPCGVFSWPAPTGLVTGLSDLLDTGVLEIGSAVA